MDTHAHVQLPLLAAIVVIPDSYQTVERVIKALKAQSCARQMEIVFVVPSRAAARVPLADLYMFHSVQVIEMPALAYGPAMAEGVRRARAPIVAMTEDHAFPAPNWAERLIAAHQGLYVAVGPALRNGNPASLISRADFYIGYGKWAEPIASSVQDFLMGHNGSYKRAVLLEFGARLDEVLDAETAMQFELARRGYQFWLEATTYTSHLNFERSDSWLPALLNNGRIFAAQRAAKWSAVKRAAYALASPLIPFVRLRRVRRDIARAHRAPGSRLPLYTVVWVGLVVDAAGQCLGYALGRGDSRAQSMRYEFHRERYLDSVQAQSAE